MKFSYLVNKINTELNQSEVIKIQINLRFLIHIFDMNSLQFDSLKLTMHVYVGAYMQAAVYRYTEAETVL